MGSLCSKEIQKEKNLIAQTSINENTNLKEERLKNVKGIVNNKTENSKKENVQKAIEYYNKYN